jgi:hypothetical protein
MLCASPQASGAPPTTARHPRFRRNDNPDRKRSAQVNAR